LNIIVGYTHFMWQS